MALRWAAAAASKRLPRARCGRGAGRGARRCLAAAVGPLAEGWDTAGAPPALREALRAAGFAAPTPVQLAAAPAVAAGRSVAVRAYTGSGKTLAYMVPLLARSLGKAAEDGPDTVVVAPSQELAMQIVRAAHALLEGPESKHAVQQCIGGANLERQLAALQRHRPRVVVGTPGRLAELSRRGALRTHRTRTLVLDEADELLADTFWRDMVRLREHVGRQAEGGRQLVVVSATLDVATAERKYAGWCDGALEVVDVRGGGNAGVGGAAAPADSSPREAAHGLAPTLAHYHVVVPGSRHRTDALRRAVHALGSEHALVFAGKGSQLGDVAARLGARGMPTGALHGELDKQGRSGTLARFRSGKTRCLLVTELGARGLDFPECDAVFNLQVPGDEVSYCHRAGRTGRAGNAGVVVTLADERELPELRRLGRRLGIAIPELSLAGGEATPKLAAGSASGAPAA